MKKNIVKVILYLFVALCVLFSVISRVGMRGLYVFIDLPSLFWIILGILFTGLNSQLKDIFTVLLYPWRKDRVVERAQYYKTVLREVNKNIFRFVLLAFVLGVYCSFSCIESTWCLVAGILRGIMPLFYAFVVLIFVVKPIETAIDRIGEEEV